MAIKDFDAKQFMLEKGERVGLGVALFLMVLLIIVSLFLPSHGFFSGSPTEKAKSLEKSAGSVQQQLASSQPGEEDKPQPAERTLAAIREFKPVDGHSYQLAADLFAPSQLGPSKRRMPELLPIKEGRAVVTLNQIRTIMMEFQRDNILVYLLNDEGGKGGGNRFGNVPGMFGRGGPGGRGDGRGGIPGGIFGPSGAGNRMGRGMPGMPGMGGAGMGSLLGAADNKKDIPLKPVRLDKLREESNPHYAEQVLPLRAAIIAASFPYRAQLEEFREKLRLPTTADVLNEPSTETDPEAGSNLNAFRFLRVEVERAVLGIDGKPMKLPGQKSEWVPIDLKAAYTPYLVLTAKQFEPDDPKYDLVSFDGLVMPRLKLFNDDNAPDAGAGEAEKKDEKKEATHNEYPKVEDQLAMLRKTLEELKNRDPNTIQRPPSQFTVDKSFNVFSRAGENTQQGAPGMPGMPGMPGAAGREGGEPSRRPGLGGPAMPSMPGGFRGPASLKPGAAGGVGRIGPGAPGMPGGPGMPGMDTADSTPPEYCLVRVVDPTVEPGFVYQYRLRVRMANPNYGRNKEVASLTYAQEKELPVDDSKWYVVPNTVSVPPDLYYYAVDQLDLDGGRNKYKGINRDVGVSKDRTALQLHRWLEGFQPKGSTKTLPVGEWVVAERVIINRGEYVGRRQRIEFPYWRTTQEQFVVATEPGATRKAPGVEVSFRPARPDGLDTVLVDFEGGRQECDRVISRDEDGKEKKKKVQDVSANEVLLLTPDGKLLAHEGAEDTKDKERVERLKQVQDRIKEVKNPSGGGTQPGGPGKPGGRNPFGGNNT
jgi:hypothetical protein